MQNRVNLAVLAAAILGESSAKFSLLRKENEAPLRARRTIKHLVSLGEQRK
jgi:hypothetical protein